MHTITTNDVENNPLARGLQPLDTLPDVESHQSPVFGVTNQLPDSTPIALSYIHKIPLRKSSKTFCKVANDSLVGPGLPESPSKASGVNSSPPSTQRRRNTFRSAGTVSKQAMPLPQRTTSLREPPKRRKRRGPVSLHKRGRGVFSSIDDMLAVAHEPTPREPSFESQISTKNPSVSLDSEASYATRQSMSAPEYLACTADSPDRPFASPGRPDRPPVCTTISWTSDETRLVEYDKIDRSHSGLRGFCKLLVPKSWCKGGRRDFFSGECDGNSVRRYRLSIPEKIGAAMMRDRNWGCF